MEVALYAPKSLDKLISLAETEEQKTSVIKALNKVNKKNSWSGWLMVC